MYVHCWAGCSRSASIVLAYLVLKQRMRLADAVKTVRKERSVYPNAGFRAELTEFDIKVHKEKTLEANG